MDSTSAPLDYTFKHLVVVHGIGDQKLNETVINFMNAFIRSMPQEIRTTVEIHNLVQRTFTSVVQAVTGTLKPEHAAYLTLTAGGRNYAIAFSEVFWQPITNAYLDQNHQPPITIFPWAHSINARCFKEDSSHRLVREAIDNLETMLALLKRLATIYKKSGQFTTILERFLGDVEMYTESQDIRDEVNREFFRVIGSDRHIFADVQQELADAQAWLGNPAPQWNGDGEIHVIAHSEGTVVSYFSLVQAANEWARDKALRPWLPRVKGLVTMGTPLDKHYCIWHNRFRTNNLEAAAVKFAKIPWFNYWDRSDPVGMKLEVLRGATSGAADIDKLFNVQFDVGFARYPIPGLAHVGYWDDPEIHLDILQKVLGIGDPRTATVTSRWWGQAWIMNGGDRLSYALGRVITLAAIAFFLARVLSPLWSPALVAALRSPGTGSGGGPWFGSWLSSGMAAVYGIPGFHRDGSVTWQMVAESLALVAVLKTLQVVLDSFTRDRVIELYKRGSAVVLSAWLLVVALVVARQFQGPVEIKDWIGYATGLVVSILIWMLHTTVHKGLVQMWRYTTGWKTLRKKSVDAAVAAQR